MDASVLDIVFAWQGEESHDSWLLPSSYSKRVLDSFWAFSYSYTYKFGGEVCSHVVALLFEMRHFDLASQIQPAIQARHS